MLGSFPESGKDVGPQVVCCCPSNSWVATSVSHLMCNGVIGLHF